jgi:hypothetical protein
MLQRVDLPSPDPVLTVRRVCFPDVELGHTIPKKVQITLPQILENPRIARMTRN